MRQSSSNPQRHLSSCHRCVCLVEQRGKGKEGVTLSESRVTFETTMRPGQFLAEMFNLSWDDLGMPGHLGTAPTPMSINFSHLQLQRFTTY